MNATAPEPAWKTLSAVAIIYFVWGSTFLAIRIGVREIPPYLLASIRLLIAGLILLAWMLARGEPSQPAANGRAQFPRAARWHSTQNAC